MEFQKILNLLNKEIDSRFAKRNWNVFNDQSNANYIVGNEIIYCTGVLKSNLCDYVGTYIPVRIHITVLTYPVI